MIGSRLPKDVAAGHPGITNHYILQGVVEGVAHVQSAGHVWRRDHDGVGRRVVADSTRVESAGFFPVLVMLGLHGLGGICLFKHAVASFLHRCRLENPGARARTRTMEPPRAFVRMD